MPEDEIGRIVDEAQRLAVVGYSQNAARPSHGVAAYLAEQAYDVVPVNPAYAGEEALGTNVRASLADVEGPIDAVVVFRRPESVPDHVDEAIGAGAPVFWMQSGITNEQAAERLEEAGVTVVQDRCFKVEHQRRA